MPVDFESYNPDQGRIDLSEGTNARTLLSLLLRHHGVGFTPKELYDETGIPRGSINPTLDRLEAAGLVQHKGAYWAVVADNRLAAASASILGLQSAEAMNANDWYAQARGWADDLQDIRTEEE